MGYGICLKGQCHEMFLSHKSVLHLSAFIGFLFLFFLIFFKKTRRKILQTFVVFLVDIAIA
jgi:hypothetical protein